MNYTLYNKDCFDVFPEIPDGSVDLVLTDPPSYLSNCCLKSESKGYMVWA